MTARPAHLTNARPCGDGYVVTSYGDVWSSHKGEWHKLATATAGMGGYRTLSIKRDGRRFRAKVAILVCEAFHGPKPFPKAVVRHLDGCNINDCAQNLAWGTQSENLKDAVIHGTSPAAENGRRGSVKLRGTNSHFAKLDWDTAREIRRRRADGQTLKAIAQDFGIHLSTVSLISRGQTWNESAILEAAKVTAG